MEYEKINQKAIIDANDIKRVKVTCRCGHTEVYEVVAVKGTIPIIECVSCGQAYGFQPGKKLIRLDKNMQPEAAIADLKSAPTIEGTWTTSESKLVN